MSNRIITISRKFGSGGRRIGRKVAEKLGIHCYDSELIARVADEILTYKAGVGCEGGDTGTRGFEGRLL